MNSTFTISGRKQYTASKDLMKATCAVKSADKRAAQRGEG